MTRIRIKYIKKLLIAVTVIMMITLTACTATAVPAEPPATVPDTVPSSIPSQQSPVLPDFISVLSVVKPSVVAINTEIIGYDLFNRPIKQEAAGSGWILDESGLVVTNNHVIEGAEVIAVVLSDGQTIPATVVGADALSDLAVLKIDAPNLDKIDIADVSKLQVGEWVLSVGNSLGLGITAKEGIISRVGVTLQASSQESIDKLIETSAAINPGNSGGPLVNMRGEIVGITSIKIATSGVEGMGYAISIGEALPIIQELIRNGYVIRPWMGIGVYDVDQFVVQQFDLAVDSGVLVTQVSPNSPAEQAGIQQGDVIVGFNDKEITGSQELGQEIRSSEIGSTVEITYWRGDKKNKTTVTLIESPAPTG